MSLNSRIKDAKHWAHKARLRFLGARHNLREARERIEDIQKRLPKAQGGVKDDLQAELKAQQRRKAKLSYQVKHRFRIWRHLRKKLNHLEKVRDKRQDHETPSGGNCGFSTPAASWNPYGRQIPNWMIPWLDKSRAAGWSGVVVSGVRTPQYSQSLCYAMCGHPTCPGTCAGVNSNHNMTADQCYPYGAIDISDQFDFESIQYRIGSPLRNYLPADTVHFSVSGR